MSSHQKIWKTPFKKCFWKKIIPFNKLNLLLKKTQFHFFSLLISIKGWLYFLWFIFLNIILFDFIVYCLMFQFVIILKKKNYTVNGLDDSIYVLHSC